MCSRGIATRTMRDARTSSRRLQRSRDRGPHSVMLSRRPQEGNSTKILGTHLLPRSPHDDSSGRRTDTAARGRSRARRLDRAGTSLLRARLPERNRERPFGGQLRELARELGRMPRRANKMRRRFHAAVSRLHRDQRLRSDYDLSSRFETRAVGYACNRSRQRAVERRYAASDESHVEVQTRGARVTIVSPWSLPICRDACRRAATSSCATCGDTWRHRSFALRNVIRRRARVTLSIVWQ